MKNKLTYAAFILLFAVVSCTNEDLMSLNSSGSVGDVGKSVTEPVFRRIQAEDFISQNGLKIENTSDVDGGQHIGFINSGDYAVYNVNVNVAAVYKMKFRVATDSNGGEIVVLRNNEQVAKSVVSSSDKGWQNWFNTSTVDIYLAKGDNTIKLKFVGDSYYLFNINWFTFYLKSSSVGVNLVTSNEINSIPLPTLGKRWIVNWDYTDEFNGDKLDDSKWQKYIPSWKGRAPGYFAEENVNVKDGYLKINGGIPDEPIVVTNWDKSKTTYTKTCGACSSKKLTASYGYYECKFKANKTTLSSTFWFSSRANFTSPLGGIFSEELDVCECIGRAGDFSGSYMYDGMHSNIHYWYKDAANNGYDMRASTPGGQSWETGYSQNLQEGNKPCDNFHTYGCWWATSTAAAFYLDNNDGGVVPFNFKLSENQPSVDVSQCVINHPMGMNMVVETYPSPWVELPSDDEITDPSKNTTLYDWVRSYTLVDCDKDNLNKKNMYMFENHIHCTDKPNRAYVGGFGFKLAYTANKDCSLIVKVYSQNNAILKTLNYNVYAGYTFKQYWVSYEAIVGSKYYVFAYLMPKGSTDISKAYEIDSYETVVK